MDDGLIELLRAATGATGPIRLVITDAADSSSYEQTIETPFALIGRAPNCDVQLNGNKVSSRHAYLQVIDGQIFCVDLGSRNGTHWAGGKRRADWLIPGRRVRIGSFYVELAEGLSTDENESERSLADFNPLNRYENEMGALPEVDLEFLREDGNNQLWLVSRMLTLVGQVPGCKIRIADSGSARMHCSLLHTKQGLWVIDLLKRETVLIDGKPSDCRLLENDEILEVDNFRMRVKCSQLQMAADGKEPPRQSPLSLSALDELPPFPDAEEPVAATIEPPAGPPDIILADDLDSVGSLPGLSYLDAESSTPVISTSSASSVSDLARGALEEQWKTLQRAQELFHQESRLIREQAAAQQSQWEHQQKELQSSRDELDRQLADVAQQKQELNEERERFNREKQGIVDSPPPPHTDSAESRMESPESKDGN